MSRREIGRGRRPGASAGPSRPAVIAKSLSRIDPFVDVHAGMNLDDVLRLARRIGISVSQVRRTGELRLSVPQFGQVKFNARRKDAPRAVTAFVRRYVRDRKSRIPKPDSDT